jgi:lyso-ornithine lipid O-acyltransferase
MTSLFAAAKPSGESTAGSDAVVQTLSVVYTRLHGIPLGRADRPGVAWYGDMEMRSHAWELLKAGPLDVQIRVGLPVPLASFADRKELARHSEAEVREHVIRILRARPAEEAVAIAAPENAPSAVRVRAAAEPGQKWV